jgi:hypothetical protein
VASKKERLKSNWRNGKFVGARSGAIATDVKVAHSPSPGRSQWFKATHIYQEGPGELIAVEENGTRHKVRKTNQAGEGFRFATESSFHHE